MSQELEQLESQVKRVTSVAGSAVTLIQGLAAEIVRLKDDPVKLQALADELAATSTALGDAVAANTTG